jgi:hypothetical protein
MDITLSVFDSASVSGSMSVFLFIFMFLFTYVRSLPCTLISTDSIQDMYVDTDAETDTDIYNMNVNLKS